MYGSVNVVIAADDAIGRAADRQRQILVVLWITASLDDGYVRDSDRRW
jgi:hypothetical protein